MMCQLKWLKVEQRHQLHEYVMMYKVINIIASQYLRDYFTELTDAHATCGSCRHLLEIQKKYIVSWQRTCQYLGTKHGMKYIRI